jgi:hypothetical protein
MDTDGMLKNLSNHEMEGAAVVKLKGKLMGNGVAIAEGTFEAEKSGPAFDIAVRIEEVSVPTMNDLLRAYGRFARPMAASSSTRSSPPRAA